MKKEWNRIHLYVIPEHSVENIKQKVIGICVSVVLDSSVSFKDDIGASTGKAERAGQ